MKTWFIIVLSLTLFLIKPLNIMSISAPSLPEFGAFEQSNFVGAPPKNTKWKQTKKADFNEKLSKLFSKPNQNKRVIPAERHWHLMTFFAVLFMAAFGFLLYASLHLSPALLYWIFASLSPFIAYLFAWLAYKKCEEMPEKFNGNQINWFIIAIVTVLIYILMVAITVLVPILFILSIIYGNGSGIDLFGLWSMWENPPKIPTFPRRS